MPLVDILVDRLTLIPPSDTPDGQGGFVRSIGLPAPPGSLVGVPARVEPQRTGRRYVAEQGDVSVSTHTLFVQAQLLDSTGAVTMDVARQLDIDWHVRNPDTGDDYIVIAKPRLGRNFRGASVLLQADLQIVKGGL